MTTLCRPGGSVTFFCANCLILLRTTSMPLQHASEHDVDLPCEHLDLNLPLWPHSTRPPAYRSSDAFSSSTASLYAGPSSLCAICGGHVHHCFLLAITLQRPF